MFRSFRSQIIGPVAAITLILVAIASVGFTIWATSHERTILQHQIDDRVAAIQSLFETTELLMEDRVKSGVDLLSDEIASRGGAEQGKPTQVGALTVNDILIGGRGQANNFELVDHVAEINRGTATIFSKEGERFVRISTNVLKDNGERAIGTVLDDRTPAYAALIEGRSFFGVVDILGNPYFTAYVPLKNRLGDVIGVSYVGYKADLQSLAVALDQSRLLDDGFIAVVDDHNIRYLPSWANRDEAVRHITTDTGWAITRHPLERWGLTIVAAYPRTQLRSAGNKIGYGVAIGGVVMCLAILLTLFLLLNSLLDRTVLQLLGGEPKAAVNYMTSIAKGDLAIEIETTIGHQDSLMATLKIMQLKLRNMITAVRGAAAEVSDQARGFEAATASYQRSRDEATVQELLQRTKAVNKTLTLLEVAIGRFKL